MATPKDFALKLVPLNIRDKIIELAIESSTKYANKVSGSLGMIEMLKAHSPEEIERMAKELMRDGS